MYAYYIFQDRHMSKFQREVKLCPRACVGVKLVPLSTYIIILLFRSRSGGENTTSSFFSSCDRSDFLRFGHIHPVAA